MIEAQLRIQIVLLTLTAKTKRNNLLEIKETKE
jgi:hypothetical protein